MFTYNMTSLGNVTYDFMKLYPTFYMYQVVFKTTFLKPQPFQNDTKVPHAIMLRMSDSDFILTHSISDDKNVCGQKKNLEKTI